MGFLDMFFRRRPPADYSLVRGDDGSICGLWLADPAIAGKEREGYIEGLLIKHGAIDLIGAPRRVVANRFNKQGGCFVMFGSGRAPGE